MWLEIDYCYMTFCETTTNSKPQKGTFLCGTCIIIGFSRWRNEIKVKKKKLKTKKTSQNYIEWRQTKITTIWPYSQHHLHLNVNVKVHAEKTERIQILLLSLVNQKTALERLTGYVVSLKWHGKDSLVIHPTPSTGHTFKYPARTLR